MEDEPESSAWTNPIEFPPTELEVRWSRRRRAATALGVVCFLALLAGSILTYRQGRMANESGDLDVCLAGAEAAAIVDFGRDSVPAEDLSDSFRTLERVSSELPWRDACARVLADPDLDLEDLGDVESAEPVTVLAELRRLASQP